LASNNHNSNGHPARRRRNTWLAAGVIAAVVLIPIFSRRTPLAVHVTTVERGPIRSLVSTNGKIEPLENAYFEAHSPIATVVQRLLVKEGAEGVVAFAFADGRSGAVKIDDGMARGRTPVTAAVLRLLGAVVPDALATIPVMGGGAEVGTVRAVLQVSRTRREAPALG